MWSNTKLLIIFSFLVMLTGIGFLWLGWNQNIENHPAFSPSPVAASQRSPVATTSAVEALTSEKAVVARVVDGDTIELSNGQAVRFVGMDTPETVDPRRPVGCFGKEASNETKSLLSGKEVILEKDVSETDKYGRLLRLVFLPLAGGQFLFVNDYLVREGFAKVKTYPPDVKYESQFKQAQAQAKENKKGLWGKCN